MLFMVIERFRGQDGKPVYRHVRDKGRQRRDRRMVAIVPVVADKGTGAARADLP